VRRIAVAQNEEIARFTLNGGLSVSHLILPAALLLALLLGARRCRICDTRVPLLSELPTTAAYLHPNSKAYEASLSFESPPRIERCIEVFEYLSPSFLSSFLLFNIPQVEKELGNKQGILEVTSYPVDVPQGRQTRHWEFNI
jgi:hypothetical protein